MIHTECKDCELSEGDCDQFGDCMFFKSNTRRKTMNDDLISREALRKAFHKRIYCFNKISWDEANAIIDNAQPIERSPNEWTPVSEGLPKKNMACLVAVGKLNLTQIAIYSDLMGTIKRKLFYQGDYGHENFEDITKYVNAWMPLPKPYKEENDGQKEKFNGIQ